MKPFIFLVFLAMAGCASTENNIFVGKGNVYCTSSVDKPVSVSTVPSVTANGNSIPASIIP